MHYVREIYKKVVEDSEYMDAAVKTMEKKIQKSMEDYREQITEADYELLRDIIFGVAAVAEEEAFLVGFQYAIGLMLDKDV